jgi:type IV pilus assembly protein PilC
MMAVFDYTAKDASGEEMSGVYKNISSVQALKGELSKLGYSLVHANRHHGERAKKSIRLKQSDVVEFAHEFAGMYSSGLSVVRCLDTIEDQTENEELCTIISDVRSKVESGSTLKDAFADYGDLFSEFFIGMLEAGETGSKLGETLYMAAEYLEKQADVRSRIKAAMAYPVIVSVMCFLIVSALVVFVVPVFQKLYRQLHVSLPGPTLILIAVSEAVRQYWWFVLPAIVISVFGIRYALKQEAVKDKIDRIKLRVPIFGKLNKLIISSQYIRTFAMMCSAGIPVIDSLALASRVVDNNEVTEISDEIGHRVLTGSGLAEPMSEYDLFPPMIVQLAGSGEEGGILPEMLMKGVGFMDKKVEKSINALIVKIEPVLSVIMGALVGSILLAVYLPMFDYMGQIK